MEAVNENPYGKFDRYDLRHYLEHLENAQRSVDVHAVLVRESKYREASARKWYQRIRTREISNSEELRVTNAWYSAHENIGETESFLSDVARCWRLAEQATFTHLANPQLANIALEFRYAIISASVNNLAGNIPPPLLASALERSLITPSQALAYARNPPDPGQKALALAAIAPHLDELSHRSTVAEALSIAQTITDQMKLSATLVALASHFEEFQLLDAVEIASQILFPNDRLTALIALARPLTGNDKKKVIEQAMALIDELGSDYYRVEALIALAPELPAEQAALLERALGLLEQMDANYQQGEAIEKFIRIAPDAMLDRANKLALNLEMEESRVTALSPLAARLSYLGNEEGALNLIGSISPEKYGKQRALALTESSQYLSRDSLHRGFKLAVEILTDQYRSMALAGMAPYLSEDLVRKALAGAKALRDPTARARLFTALAPRLEESDKDVVLGAAASALKDNLSQDNADFFNDLLGLSPNSLVKLLFNAAKKIDDRPQQLQAIARLIGKVDQDWKRAVLHQLLEQTSRLKVESERADTNVLLIPLLLEAAQVREATELAWKIRPWIQFAKALSSLFTHLENGERKDQLEKIFLLLEKSGDQTQQVEVISEVGGHLYEESPARTINCAIKMNWAGGRIRALCSLAPYVSEQTLREYYFDEAARVADNFSKRNIQIAIAARLASLGHSEEAFVFTLSDEDELSRTNMFEGIIPHLPEQWLAEVLQISNSFGFDGRKYSVFAMLAPRFAELGNERAAEYLIAETKSPMPAALAAARVAKYASDATRIRAIHHALTIVKNMQGAFGEGQGWWQAEALECVVPYLNRDLLAEAFSLAVKIEEENDRRKALSALVLNAVRLPLETLYEIWNSSLHYLATRSRRHLLSDISALSPIIVQVGGVHRLSEVIAAIDDACRWW